jgi:serine/threonine protein kinase
LIAEKRGQGSYGSVFKGLDESSNTNVAVKLIDLRAVKDIKSQYLKDVQVRLV